VPRVDIEFVVVYQVRESGILAHLRHVRFRLEEVICESDNLPANVEMAFTVNKLSVNQSMGLIS
jgi:hypothetical protein